MTSSLSSFKELEKKRKYSNSAAGGVVISLEIQTTVSFIPPFSIVKTSQFRVHCTMGGISRKDISVDLEEKSPIAIPIIGAKIGLKIRAA